MCRHQLFFALITLLKVVNSRYNYFNNAPMFYPSLDMNTNYVKWSQFFPFCFTRNKRHWQKVKGEPSLWEKNAESKIVEVWRTSINKPYRLFLFNDSINDTFLFLPFIKKQNQPYLHCIIKIVHFIFKKNIEDNVLFFTTL